MSCSGEWKVCRQTYFLVYTGVLVAASPAETSKETPEGQVVVAAEMGVKRVQLQNSFLTHVLQEGTMDASWV